MMFSCQAVLLGSGHSDPDFRALAAGEFKCAPCSLHSANSPFHTHSPAAETHTRSLRAIMHVQSLMLSCSPSHGLRARCQRAIIQNHTGSSSDEKSAASCCDYLSIVALETWEAEGAFCLGGAETADQCAFSSCTMTHWRTLSMLPLTSCWSPPCSSRAA